MSWFLLDLLTNRVPPGVDEASYVKAAFLAAVARGEVSSELISAQEAVELLGTMLGGYNVAPLVELLQGKPYGLMCLLDEEVRVPQGSDAKFLAKASERQRDAPPFGALRPC